MNEIITYAFLFVGVFVLIGYVPNIITMLKSKETDTNILGWGMWTVCSFVSILYFWVVKNDSIAALIQGGHLIGCLTIFSIQLMKRRKS